MQRKPKIAPLVADTEQIAGNTAAPSSASEGSGGGGKAFVTAVIAIVALAVAGFAYYKFHSAPKGPYFENASVDRLTQSGSAAVVAISPDGQMIAYALRNGAEQSVMVRQVRTGNDAQLIAPA